MVNINFAKKEHIVLISEFENNYFHDEAYSLESLEKMLEDNYLLKTR